MKNPTTISSGESDERAAFLDLARMYCAVTETPSGDIEWSFAQRDIENLAAEVVTKHREAKARAALASTAPSVGEPVTAEVPENLTDDALDDLSYGAYDEALSFGLSRDVFSRYFRTIRDRVLAPVAAHGESDYEALEREHLGDPDKQTGIYAPRAAESLGELRHICNLWVDPATRDYVVDRCDHPTSELIAAYALAAPAASVPESPAATEAPSLIKLVSQADAWADWLKTNDAPINAASRETLAGVLSRCVAALASPAPSVGEPKSNNQKEKKCTPTSADGTTQRNACLGIGGGPSSAITSSDTPTERELDLYDEIECDLPYLFGRAAFEGHASAQALADQVREKMKRARFLYATPPAAPAATEAPSAEQIITTASHQGMWGLRDEAGNLTVDGRRLIGVVRALVTPAPAVGASVQPVLASLSDEPLIEMILDGLNYDDLRAKAIYLMQLNANQARTIDGLADDAERYRHLVATCNIDFDPSEPWQLVIWEPATGEDWKAKLDAAIDVSLASSTPTKGGEAS